MNLESPGEFADFSFCSITLLTFFLSFQTHETHLQTVFPLLGRSTDIKLCRKRIWAMRYLEDSFHLYIQPSGNNSPLKTTGGWDVREYMELCRFQHYTWLFFNILFVKDFCVLKRKEQWNSHFDTEVSRSSSSTPHWQGTECERGQRDGTRDCKWRWF